MVSKTIPCNSDIELHILQDDKENLTLTILLDRWVVFQERDDPRYDSVDLTYEDLETLYLAAKAYKES